MGDVYLATHNLFDRQYAIKVLKRRFQSNQAVVRRFQRGALAASRVHHPNAVHIHDFGQTDDGRFFIVMEYAQGEHLSALMAKAVPGLLPLEQGLRILGDVAGALVAAHAAQIVHRDVQPGNIKVAQDDWGRDHVKLLDFGVARVAEEAAPLTLDGEVFGALGYMAPEQAAGRSVDHRADLYALGAVAYELLTGRRPYEATSLPGLLIAHQQYTPAPCTTLRPANLEPVPTEVESLVMRCLAVDPAARPSDTAVVEQVLQVVMGERGRQSRRRRNSVHINPVKLEAIYAGHAQGTADGAPAQPGAGPASVDPTADPSRRAASVMHPGRAPVLMGAEPVRPRPASPSAADQDPATVLEAVHEPLAGFVTLEEEQWGHVYRLCVGLAEKLTRRGHGSTRLPKLLTKLSEHQSKLRALDNEHEVLQSRRVELERTGHVREAQLRNAVIDLSLERARYESDPIMDPAALADLNYQIGQLEKRLSEVGRETQEALRHNQGAMARISNDLEALKAGQLGLMLRLIGHLRSLEPHRMSADIAKLWRAIEALLPS